MRDLPAQVAGGRRGRIVQHLRQRKLHGASNIQCPRVAASALCKAPPFKREAPPPAQPPLSGNTSKGGKSAPGAESHKLREQQLGPRGTLGNREHGTVPCCSRRLGPTPAAAEWLGSVPSGAGAVLAPDRVQLVLRQRLRLLLSLMPGCCGAGGHACGAAIDVYGDYHAACLEGALGQSCPRGCWV